MTDKRRDMVLAPPIGGPASPFAATTSDTPSRVERVAKQWTSLPGGVVDGGEIVILAIKPSMWRPLSDSAAWVVTATFLALALTILGRPLPGLSVTTSAQVILLLGFSRLGMAIVRWVPTWYVLTNRRIIEIHGVRTPRIHAVPLVGVRNTYVRLSSWERYIDVGTISYVTTNTDEAPGCWQSVSQPEAVHSQIRRAIEQAIDQFGMSA
ncbi:MAG: hypothetical protein AABZ12_01200 [Planctomycetota bacterium]